MHHHSVKTTTSKAHHAVAAAKPTSKPKGNSLVADGSGSNNDNSANAHPASDSTSSHGNTADSGNGARPQNDAAVAPEEATPTPDSDASAEPSAVPTSPVDSAPSGLSDPNAVPSSSSNSVSVDNIPTGGPVNANVSNKTIGITVGAAIGCVAAVGLAGMMVYKRKTRQRFDDSIGAGNIDGSMDESAQTHWRPTSFMAAVTSVVARLPRDRNSSSSRGSGGFAASVFGSLRRVGSGRSNRSSSSSVSEASHNSMNSHTSFGYAVSGPLPELARVDHNQFQEVDLRAR